MATKKPPNKTKTLLIENDHGKTKEQKLAEVKLSSLTLNTNLTTSIAKPLIGEVSFTNALEVMREKVDKINAGDLKDLESTLTVQATSLDAIFNLMAMRANNSANMSKLETYMRLGLKAQAQCARTIEVLAAMKNPPVIYARQANISNGNQQVNNGGFESSSRTHAGKSKKPSNELLEVNNGSETMDISAAQFTGRKDKAMATLEALNRGENATG